MAFRDRMEEVAAAWRDWPRWRRLLFAASGLAAALFAAWLLAAGLGGHSALEAGALPDVAAPLAVPPELAAAADGDASRDAAREGALRDVGREAALERGLATKARALLERVVGEGRVVVEVRAELDWSRREATRERFDPEGQVERSEERSSEPAAPKAPTRTTERVEYDVSKEVTREITPGGELRRLHLAVLLDARGAEGTDVAAPDAAQLEALAKQAVGFSTARGDVFSLVRVPFHEASPLAGLWPPRVGLLLPALGLLLAVGAASWVLWRRDEERSGEPTLPMTAAALEAALLQGGAAAMPESLAADVADVVSPGRERDAGAAALRAWLEER